MADNFNKENSNSKFIYTDNPLSYEFLSKAGLQCLSNKFLDKYWIFVNDGKMMFSNLDGLHYTNRLTF